jgi:hypothetical protein
MHTQEIYNNQNLCEFLLVGADSTKPFAESKPSSAESKPISADSKIFNWGTIHN